MIWLDNLISFWAKLANRLAEFSADIQVWFLAPAWFKSAIRSISSFVDGIFSAFFDFRLWANILVNQVASFLTWDQIQVRIQVFIDRVNEVWSFFTGIWTIIRIELNSWWQGTSTTVKTWIAVATQGLSELRASWDNFVRVTLPELTGKVTELTGAWSNFWTVTIPTLVTFTSLGSWWSSRLLDVQGLISSAFTLREDLWKGWQQWRDQVAEFFSDPEDYLIKALERALDRFW